MRARTGRGPIATASVVRQGVRGARSGGDATARPRTLRRAPR